ncbi:hypothetical protein RIF29_26848 [Crotalaria pallida]|uniref:Uncharacterized protein n=1 Tax=Crotalaria pallida TaxID=3830 RepID=A0AAN9EQD7_CROPI
MGVLNPTYKGGHVGGTWGAATSGVALEARHSPFSFTCKLQLLSTPYTYSHFYYDDPLAASATSLSLLVLPATASLCLQSCDPTYSTALKT